MQRGFIQLPILLILAVVVLVGAYYVGTSAGKLPQINVNLTPPLPPEVPSSNETANWKTYTSSNFGLTFKYPPGIMKIARENTVISTASPESGIDVVVFKIIETTGCKDCSRIISFNVADNTKNLSINKYVEQTFSPVGLSSEKDFQKYTVDGEDGLISINGLPGQEYRAGVLSTHKNKIYSFEVSTWQVSTAQSEETFSTLKQILSTFRFD